MMAALSTIEASTSGDLLTENLFTVDPNARNPPLFGKITVSFVCCFGLPGNLIIILLYLKSTALRNPPNMFFINLAISDLGFLICVGPTINNMVRHGGQQGYSDLACFFQGLIIIICASTSLVNIGLISFSRYIAIVRPAKKQMFTWGVCFGLCVSSWAYSTLLMVPALLGWGRVGWIPSSYCCGYDWEYNTAYNILVFLFLYGFVSIFVTFCYYNIYKVFQESKRRVAGEGVKGKTLSKTEFRLALQLLVIFAIYNITWCPYFSMSMFIDPQGKGPEWYYCILLTLVYWNSAVNILVYFYFNTVFRAEFFSLFGVKPSSVTESSATKSVKSSD